jgi:hypothetical protein
MLYQPQTKARLGTFLQARKLAAVGVLCVAGIVTMHLLYSPVESVASKSVDRPDHISDAPEQVLETPMPVAVSNSSPPTPAIDGAVATESLTSSQNNTDTTPRSRGPETSGQSPPEQGTGRVEKSAARKQKVGRRQRGEPRVYAQNGYSYNGAAAPWWSQRSSPFRPF